MSDNNVNESMPRVLVMDDTPEGRDSYASGLSQLGCCVSTSGSRHEILHLMMQQHFDVVVLDVETLDQSSLVFLQEALRIWPWLGVLVVSREVPEESRANLGKLGVTHFLPKPVDLDELHRRIQEEVVAKRPIKPSLSYDHDMALMKEYLHLLSKFDSKMLNTRSLIASLQEFVQDMARAIPADVVGLLAVKEDENVLLLSPEVGVHEVFLKAVQEEMLTRFQTLSGKALDPSSLDLRTMGAALNPEGPTSMGSVISVPIILGAEVCGLLTLASSVPHSYTPSRVSILYHAANHIAAVFLALRRMHHLATRDPLTGLFNRMRLQEELERAWQSSRRYAPVVSVVVLDLDHFKILNDTHGHAVGDQVLREFASLLLEAARASDVVGRFGGDEFVAVLTHAEEWSAYAFADRILRRTQEKVFCSESHRINVTVSIGIASSDNPTQPSSSSELLAQADRALYLAKRAGRNRISVWSSSNHQEELELGEPPPSDPASKPAHARVMVVDDEPSVLLLVSAFLKRADCEAETFTSGRAALETLRQKPDHYDLLLTDISMPDFSGIDLLAELAGSNESLVKLVMTSYATVDTAVQCLRQGAYDFIPKPIDLARFEAIIRRALEYRALRVENARYQAQLERMVTQRGAQLTRTLEDVKASYKFTLEALMAMLDSREHQTGRHSLRVRELAVTLARHMGLSGPELEAVATGALLHDIGKIGLPDEVLFHAGPLSAGEWDTMRTHPEVGARIVRHSPHLQEAARIVHEHHEHFDGTGYPRGLAGEDICLGARIFSVIDAYDAMRSDRIYRGSLSPEDAATEMMAHRGSQFDPRVVDAFLACQESIESRFRQMYEGAVPQSAEVPPSSPFHPPSSPGNASPSAPAPGA